MTDNRSDMAATLCRHSVFRDACAVARRMFRLAVFVDEAQNTPVEDTTRGVIELPTQTRQIKSLCSRRFLV